jgi:hypothetical protein
MYCVRENAYILLQVITLARTTQSGAAMVELLARLLSIESSVLHPFQAHLLNRRFICSLH